MHVTLVNKGGCLEIVAADALVDVGAKPMPLTGLWSRVVPCLKNATLEQAFFDFMAKKPEIAISTVFWP